MTVTNDLTDLRHAVDLDRGPLVAVTSWLAQVTGSEDVPPPVGPSWLVHAGYSGTEGWAAHLAAAHQSWEETSRLLKSARSFLRRAKLTHDRIAAEPDEALRHMRTRQVESYLQKAHGREREAHQVRAELVEILELCWRIEWSGLAHDLSVHGTASRWAADLRDGA